MAPTNPADLSIDLRSANEGKADRPTSSPINLEGVDLSSFGGDFTGLDLPSLPLRQRSPPSSPRQQQRDPASKNLLNNFKSRISPGPDSKGQMQEQMNRTTENGEDYRQGNSSMSKIYHLRKAAGSTPELSLVGSAENVNKVPGKSKDRTLDCVVLVRVTCICEGRKGHIQVDDCGTPSDHLTFNSHFGYYLFHKSQDFTS